MQKHISDLTNIPEALGYVVTPAAVQEDSESLQWLPHWAPCSITRALEFLTPPYKGHHRVMAYVLRVMETYPPERVTFFMPQLVQALRYDHGVTLFTALWLSDPPRVKSFMSGMNSSQLMNEDCHIVLSCEGH